MRKKKKKGNSIVLLKWPQNKIKKRKLKRAYKLFCFSVLGFKLVPIDSVLNFSSGNLAYTFQKRGCGTKKSSQTCKVVGQDFL